jgi:hypothetical protein
VSGTPLIETDLRVVRERRDLSLDHIQQATRIPLDVLRRFESGLLVGDPTYNDVYLKAFLRSYAKAVGVPQTDILAAYDAQRAGRYRGELHPDYVAPKAPAPRAEPAPGPVEEQAAPAEASEILDAPEPASPAVQALAVPPIPVPPTPSKPLPSARVGRRPSPGARRSFDRNWGTILGLFALVAAALGVAVWALVFRTPAAEEEAADPAALASVADSAAAASAGPQFALPIRLTVTAIGDGLQSFRVSQNDDRAPYWVEPGVSATFEADSSVVLWGEGEGFAFQDAVVEWQGLRWTPRDGAAVTINAATAQRLLDSLAALPPVAAPQPAPAAPAAQ